MNISKNSLYIFYFVVALSIFVISVSAHGGRTDSNGGHNSSNGYHYHHGYPAHDHYDVDGDGLIDCPYDFDDKTDHASKDNDDETVKIDKDKDTEAEKKNFGSIMISVMLDISTFLVSLGLCVAVVFPIMFALIEKTNIQIGCLSLLLISYVITFFLFSLILSLNLFF